MSISYEIFYGRLGRNPVLEYTVGPKAICILSVAVSTEINDKPEWKKVVVWGRQAELCKVQLKKGSEIFVQGQAKVKEFINKQGEKKRYEEVNARIVGFTNV